MPTALLSVLARFSAGPLKQTLDAAQAKRTAEAAFARWTRSLSRPAVSPPCDDGRVLKPAPPVTRFAPPVPSPTLLDERAYLRVRVSDPDVARWRDELLTHPSPVREARLRVQLGEVELGRSEPALAERELREAARLMPDTSRDRGLALYDMARALFLQGRFTEARHEFRALYASSLVGFEHKTAALYARHAAAYASYHASHALLGIPEPTWLEPQSGAGSLAATVRALHASATLGSVLPEVRHTGEGSDLGDLAAAVPRLGLAGEVVTMDKVGMMAIATPLVARVEHDRYVAVLGADRAGVTYEDPGLAERREGRVRLTWAQWKAMDASAFLAVAPAGSPKALALAHLPAKVGAKRVRLRLVERGVGSLAAVAAAQRALTAMAGHVALLAGQGSNPYNHTAFATDGMRGTSPQPTFQKVPLFNPSSGGSGSASFAGDPVNLATGEEEYAPAPDLTVYNPKGPSIVWGRTYSSLANTAPSGFGSGWSHTYNWRIVRNAYASPVMTQLVMPTSGRLTITPTAGESSPPTATAKTMSASFGYGVPMKVEWDYASTGNVYVVTFKDQTKWTFTLLDHNGNGLYRPTSIQDRFGNALTLQWGQVYPLDQPDPETSNQQGWVLQSISNASGPLLNVDYDSHFNITDVYEVPPDTSTTSRAIRYVVDTTLATTNSPSSNTAYQDELTRVSFPKAVTRDGNGLVTIAPWTTNQNERYVYGYQNASNLKQNTTTSPQSPTNEGVPYLYTISVPSASGLSSGGTWDGSTRATTTIATGSDGSVTSLTDGEGNKTTFTPSTNNGVVTTSVVTSTVVGPGSTRAYSLSYAANFDASLRSTHDDYFPGSTAFTPVAYTYNDPNDPFDPDTATDGNGRKWSMTYDRYGNVLTSTTPKGTVTTTSYDPTFFGQVGTSSTGNLTGTTMTYDPSTGAPTEVDAPVPGTSGGSTQATTINAYSTLGNPGNVIEPGNSTSATRKTTMAYGTDGFPQRLGLPTYVWDANGNYASMSYDVRGNRTVFVDPAGNGSNYEYNLANQVTRAWAPATGEHKAQLMDGSYVYYQSHTDYTYAYVGGPLTLVQSFPETDPGEMYASIAKTTLTYGVEGELTLKTGTGEYEAYRYDGSYRPTHVFTGTPGNQLSSGIGTTIMYDYAGRPIRERGPNSSSGTGPYTTNVTYDASGNVATVLDGRNNYKTMTYGDADGLLSAVHYAYAGGTANDGTGATYGTSLSGLGDAYGHSYDVATQYDAYDRPMHVTAGTSGQGGSDVADFRYDDLGNVTRDTRFAARQARFNYGYNPDGSVATMAVDGDLPSGGTWSYGWTEYYDAAGRFTNQDSPLGTSSLFLAKDGVPYQRGLPNGAFTVYPRWIGDQTTSRGALKGVGLCAPNNVVYSTYGSLSYTPQLALKSFSTNNGACPAMGGSTTYGYSDPSTGIPYALTSETSSRLGGYTNAYSYDTGLNPTSLRGSATTSYRADDLPSNAVSSYDTAGYYQASGTLHDVEGRMVKGPQSGWAAGYRADGLRAWKDANGSRTWYLYDLAGNPVVETDASGTPTAVNDYDGAGLVGRLSVSTGASNYYLFDPQGSVAHTLDAVRGVVDSRLYDAYGMEAARDSSGNAVAPSDPFGFNAQWGYYADREIGTYHCQNRNYAPGMGRWWEPDPIGRAGGMNLYSYCGAMPLGSVDSSGLQSLSQWQTMSKNPRAHRRIPRRPVPNYSLLYWMREAEDRNEMSSGDWDASPNATLVDMYWFYRMVKTNGPMDFKRLIHTGDADYQNAADYGNFNYGVMGSALGFGPEFLLEQAGEASIKEAKRNRMPIPSDPHGYFHGDMPRDQFYIRMGIQWYNRYKKS